jgi:hypothetical protein
MWAIKPNTSFVYPCFLQYYSYIVHHDYLLAPLSVSNELHPTDGILGGGTFPEYHFGTFLPVRFPHRKDIVGE